MSCMIVPSVFVPEESEEGRGFMSLSTILWCNDLRLKGSTVKGRVPVSMAYMLTPLYLNKSTYVQVIRTAYLVNITTYVLSRSK